MNNTEQTARKRTGETELVLDKLNEFVGLLSAQTIRFRSELNRLKTEMDRPGTNTRRAGDAVSLYDRVMAMPENRTRGGESAAFRRGPQKQGAASTAAEAGTVPHLRPQSGGVRPGVLPSVRNLPEDLPGRRFSTDAVMPDGANFSRMISDNVKSSAKLLENIRNLCEQLNRKMEEGART